MSSESVSIARVPNVSARLLYFAGYLGLLILLGLVHGLPWLIDLTPAWNWCATALGLYAVATIGSDPSLKMSSGRSNQPGQLNRWWWPIAASGWTLWWSTWFWCTLWIAVAFYWSPAAMAYTLGSEFWLGLLVATPLVLWDSPRMATGFYLASRMTRDLSWIWLPAALIITFIETFVPSVFPWRNGMTQLGWPWLIQSVDIFGSSITTVILFAHAGLLLQLYTWYRGQRVTRAAWICTVGLLCLNAIYGIGSLMHWQSKIQNADHIKVALLQVDPSYTESTTNLQKLTQQVAESVQLVCWPESSAGAYASMLDDLSDTARVFEFSREPERGLRPWPSPTRELLAGGKNFDGPADEPTCIHVTAMLIDTGERISGRYHKRFLMPFGEYVPFETSVPGLAELFDMAEHVQPGDSSEPLLSQTGAKIGAMLCYEDMVPQAAIDLTRAKANLLISLVNGSAFENPVTLRQHRLLSQLRATECRKTLLRCAATGETCVVLPTGEIKARLPLQINDALIAEAPLHAGPTIYSRFPWLGHILLSILLAIIFCQRMFRRVRF